MTQVDLKRTLLTFFVALTAIASLVLPVRISAQVVGATISGTVTDSSGAKTPSVNIAIANTATGIVSNAATNAVGVFSVPNLQPGNYQVTASAPGFSSR